MGLNNENRHFY